MTASRELPGPRGRLIGGNLADFESDRLAFLTAARRYGELVRFDDVTTIVYAHDLANAVLLDRERAFDIPSDLVGRRLGSAAITETRTLRPLLNAPLRKQRTEPVGEWVRQLLLEELAAASNQLRDPLPVIERVIFAGVARAYFGTEDVQEVTEAIAELLEALDSHFGNPFALPAFVPTRRRRHIRGAYRNALQVVQKRLAYTDRLVERAGVAHAVSDAAATTSTPPDRVAQMLVGSLLAARRVPAAAACWMLHEVSLNQDIQSQLRSEARMFDQLLAEHGRGERPDFDSREFPLAMRTALEALRLHPPTWLLHRRAIRSTELGSCRIREGHNLLISPWVLHRDNRVFARANRFDPDRWDGVTSIPRTMLAFGRGPHGCPGSSVGLTAMISILLTVVSRWRLGSTGPVIADPRSTLLPVGLRLNLRELRSSSGAESLEALREPLPRGLS